MVPWELKQATNQPEAPAIAIARHDPTMEHTLLIATDGASGTVLYNYQHRAQPDEPYHHVASWMMRLHQAMRVAYRPPQQLALARASSAEALQKAFPHYGPIMGQTEEHASMSIANELVAQLATPGIPNFDDWRSDHTALQLVEFTGTEALSELYFFDLTLRVNRRERPRAPELADLNAAIGTKCLLTLSHAGQRFRFIHGIITNIVLDEVTSGYFQYLVRFEAPQARLMLRRDLRIFQGLTVLDIAGEVLTNHKDIQETALDLETGLSHDYPIREYCTQCRESDFDFIRRILVTEGIFFYFVHDEAEVKMCFADHNDAFPKITPRPGDPHGRGERLIYRRGQREMGEWDAFNTEECAVAFRFGHHLRSGRVQLRDYNFIEPGSVATPNPVDSGPVDSERDTDLDVYDYPSLYEHPQHVKEWVADLSETTKRLATVHKDRAGPRPATGVVDHLESSDHPRPPLHPRRRRRLARRGRTEARDRRLQPRVPSRDGESHLHRWGSRRRRQPIPQRGGVDPLRPSDPLSTERPGNPASAILRRDQRIGGRSSLRPRWRR